MLLDADFDAVWGGEVAAELAGTADEGAVTFDFPAFDCGGVDGEAPYVAHEEYEEDEEGECVCEEDGEEVGEL